MADRKEMIETITGLLSGKVDAQYLRDKARHVWIETTEGYRDMQGALLTKEQFDKWAANTNISDLIIIPDNGRIEVE